MAADQRRKRLNGASIVGYNSREPLRTKRKHLGLGQNDLNMTSHISVEWDGNQKMVVAKREQVGISWRQMKPFVNFVPNGHNVMADVFAIPQEIFDLDNLTEVLSYEVWKTHLSENEINFLMDFLPRGLEAHQVVQELLSGDNFHFGNPFLKWGASLCSGDLHPDVIVKWEQQLKFDKRAYYSELHNYHNDMIGGLIKLKERWESCKDPEKEIVQKIWRSNNDVEKRMLSNVNESKVFDHDENVTATSESCSWAAEEKACSSDNQILSVRKSDKLQKRVLDKGFIKGEPRNLMVASDDMLNVGARAKKGDKLHKHNIHSSDGDKYMSCIKISKKQHELVKSMKQSGKSIQSMSLNLVLGNLDSIHVQPYGVFIKEEQKKLHEHWLQLVQKDIPVAYANWTERLVQRHAVINSLVVEMKDKSKLLLEDEDNVSSESKLHDQEEDGGLNGKSSSEDEEDSIAGTPENQSTHNSVLGGNDGFDPMGEGLEKNLVISKSDDASPNRTEYSRNMNTQDIPISEGARFSSAGDVWQESCSEKNLVISKSDDASPNRTEYSRNMNIRDIPISEGAPFSSAGDVWQESCLEKNLVISKSDDASPNRIEYSRNMNTQDIPISEGAPFSSAGDVWQAVEMPHSYYDSAVTHEYTASGLSLANTQINEAQQTRMIDLESNLPQEETGNELLQRQSEDRSFSSYPNQDRSDLLQSLFKGEGVLSYQHEKRDGLDFQTSNNVMIGDGPYPGHFKEQLQTSLTLDWGQRRPSEAYMPENMSDNIYSDGGRYLISRQDQLSAVNMTDWTVNGARLAAPSQPHLSSGEFIGQHWFPTDQVRGGWNASDGGGLSSQCLGTGGNSDQSLFSVLSQCNQLRSGSPYDSVRHTDPFQTSKTYGVVDASTPRINAVVPQASHPLDYLSGRGAPNSLVPDDMAWMSLPPQNSALHDQMGKPYLRSWNR